MKLRMKTKPIELAEKCPEGFKYTPWLCHYPLVQYLFAYKTGDFLSQNYPIYSKTSKIRTHSLIRNKFGTHLIHIRGSNMNYLTKCQKKQHFFWCKKETSH